MTDLLAGMDATMKVVEYKIAVCVEWICATTVLVAIHMTLPGLRAKTAAKRSVEDDITDVRAMTRRHFTTITVVGVKETPKWTVLPLGATTIFFLKVHLILY